MFKLIDLNYTVMLNGYSQWLNINFFIETSVEYLNIECEIIAI